MLTAVIILGWLVCSVIAYGLIYGHFTDRFPFFYYSPFDPLFIIGAIGGPAGVASGLVVPLIQRVPISFRLRPQTKEEVVKAYRERFSGPWVASLSDEQVWERAKRP